MRLIFTHMTYTIYLHIHVRMHMQHVYIYIYIYTHRPVHLNSGGSSSCSISALEAPAALATEPLALRAGADGRAAGREVGRQPHAFNRRLDRSNYPEPWEDPKNGTLNSGHYNTPMV